MAVPAVEEGVRQHELDVVAVHADFRQPVNHVADVLVGARAFDADAPVPVGRRFRQRNRRFVQRALRKIFAVRARTHPGAAKCVKQPVRAQQHAPFVRPGDLARTRAEFDAVGVVQRRLLHRKRGRLDAQAKSGGAALERRDVQAFVHRLQAADEFVGGKAQNAAAGRIADFPEDHESLPPLRRISVLR